MSLVVPLTEEVLAAAQGEAVQAEGPLKSEENGRRKLNTGPLVAPGVPPTEAGQRRRRQKGTGPLVLINHVRQTGNGNGKA